MQILLNYPKHREIHCVQAFLTFDFAGLGVDEYEDRGKLLVVLLDILMGTGIIGKNKN